MIHLDFADGTSAWLTDEQLKDQHPELYTSLRQPVPYQEYGRKLRDRRVKHEITLREMAKICGMKASELSSIELGRVMPSQEVVDCYGTLKAQKP